VANRELIVLGTASQAPTRTRNRNGYFLRWDDEGLLSGPGNASAIPVPKRAPEA
jgi:ribonuclease Z